MKFAIISSNRDKAGKNIIENLKKLNSSIPIQIVDSEIINAEDIDKTLDADFIIFASKHQSKDTKKTLTIHTIGNFHEAEYGGKNNTLVKTSALVVKHFFQTLEKENNLDYEVTLEATHHGPFINKPCLFIEIGPSEAEWTDISVGKVIAKTIIESIKTYKKKKYKIAFGIGGKHYCPNFNKIQLGNKYAISHIVPSYSLPLSKELIQKIIDNTTEKPTTVLIDWKGLKSKERNEILEILKNFNLEILKTKDAKLN